MRVYKREIEEDGMIVDPLKAVHTVKVSLTQNLVMELFVNGVFQNKKSLYCVL